MEVNSSMDFNYIINSMKSFLGDLYGPVFTILKIIGIIIISIIIIRIGSIIIKKFFANQKKFKYRISDKKIDTMATLFVSIFRYTVYIIAGATILTEAGFFRMESVLAAAGVGGIIIGLGSQSLVKDVLSGLFIILENQYVVGDLITIDTLTGTVEELEMRVTRLRNINGDLYIIPNGEIKKVINHTRGNKAVIVDIPVAYSSDIDRAFDAAARVCENAAGEFNIIVEPPKVIGITELGKESLNLRIFARTLPNEQWQVERRIRKLIKDEFDRGNILFYDKNRIINDGTSSDGGGKDA